MADRAFAAAVILLLLASCATTDIKPMGGQGAFNLQDDERRIWNRSSEEEARLNKSNLIYDDPELTAYVNEVAQKLIPADVRKTGISIEVKIIKNPLLNAFAYPNGVIYVHTGILAKMDNEAQLSTLLGHEMTHITHRHAIQQTRTVKNTAAVLAAVQMASIPFGVYGNLANLLGSIGAMASVTGYSRELESEADDIGIELMVTAGYDPQEAPKLFRYLKSDLEKNNEKEPFFFGSHPRLQDRIENFEKLAEGVYSGQTGEKGEERFNLLISDLLMDNAMMDLDMGRFNSAVAGVEKSLKMQPYSARGHFCMGEIYRQRGDNQDTQRAEKEYQQALSYDAKFPQPYKGLGILYYKQGVKNKSMDEFKKYLRLLPDALDKEYIKQYIQNLEAE